jgi:hypothetical protein
LDEGERGGGKKKLDIEVGVKGSGKRSLKEKKGYCMKKINKFDFFPFVI